MKKALKSIGKASLYFGVYLAVQFITGFVLSIVVSAQMTMETIALEQELDSQALYQQVYARVMELSTLMVLISGIVTIVIYWIIFLIRKKKFRKEVIAEKINIRGILPIILLGMALNIVIALVLDMLPFPQSWIDSYTMNSSSLGEGNVIVNWLSVVFMAPVLEEIVFRGLVYTRMKKGMPVLLAAVLSSLLFGAMHGTMIWFLYAFALGLILVWCFERFHSLAANILLHGAFNLTGQVLSLVPEVSDIAMWILDIVALVVMVGAIVWIKKLSVGEEANEQFISAV